MKVINTQQEVIKKMDEPQYRAHPAINYSLLADFKEAPDVALMQKESKSYFEEGKAFERLLEDIITGSDHFNERFYSSKVEGKMPDELPSWIKEGTTAEQYVFKQDGTPNNTYKTRHAYLTECTEYPGRIPISESLYMQLQKMVSNALGAEFMGLSMAEILVDAEFQVPIIWTKDGIEKKALVDCVATLEIHGIVQKVIIDLKSTANLASFRSMAFSRYWVQDIHYLEGALAEFGDIYPFMVFLAAAKKEPFLAQAITFKEERREAWTLQYNQLCRDLTDWKKEGCPARGWRHHEEL